MKKRFLTLFSFFFILGLLVLVGCSKKTNKSNDPGTTGAPNIQLVDFEDKTVEVELGSVYRLPNVISDASDKDYQVAYTITTKSGDPVDLSDYQLTIADLGGYIVTCTAVTAKGNITRTLTINVKDSTAPTITFGRVKPGCINEEYTLPEVNVNDASSNVTTVVKVFLVSGTVETEVTITNGKFTPTVSGKYVIKVTATDASNNKGTATTEFQVLEEKVQETVDPNEVIDFDEEDDLESVKYIGNFQERVSFSWLQSFEGETGVLKMDFNDDCAHFVFTAAQEPTAYSEYNYIVMKAYVVGTLHHISLSEKYGYYDSSLGDDGKGGIVYEEWKEYKFPMSVYLENIDNPYFMFYREPMGIGVVYVSTIYAEKTPVITINNGAEGQVNEEYTLPTYELKNFPEGYTAEVKVYFVNGENETEVTVTDGKFTPAEAGIYRMKVTITYGDGLKLSATKDLKVFGQETIDANEIIDFDEAGDLNHVEYKGVEGRVSFSWLESFEGETGVLKMDYNDDCPHFYFTPAKAVSEYAGYEYVIMKAFVTTTLHHISFNETPGTSYYDPSLGDDTRGGVVYNAWKEYKFPISILQNNENLYFMFYREPLGQGTVYVSSIYVENTPTITIVDGANGIVNVEYTLPTYELKNFPEGYTTAVKVYYVSGENETEVTVTDGIFTPAEAGTYRMKVTVTYGEGLTLTASKDLKVAESETIDKNEVIDFDEETDLNYVVYKGVEGRVSFSWLDTFEDETGVLKMDYNDDNANFHFTPAKAVSEYSSYDYIVMKAYVVGTLHHISLNETPGTSYYDPSLGDDTRGGVVYNAWKEYKFPISILQNNEDLFFMFYRDPMGEGTIYVSAIYTTKAPETVDPNEVIDFDEEEDLLSVEYKTSFPERRTLSWLESFEGETGVLKIQYNDDNANFHFTPAKAVSEYSSYDYIVMKAYVVGTLHHISLNETPGTSYYDPSLGDDTRGGVVYNAWKEYKFPISILQNNEDLFFMFYRDPMGEGTIYVSAIYVGTNE